jgi:hypothetical protein
VSLRSRSAPWFAQQIERPNTDLMEHALRTANIAFMDFTARTGESHGWSKFFARVDEMRHYSNIGRNLSIARTRSTF